MGDPCFRMGSKEGLTRFNGCNLRYPNGYSLEVAWHGCMHFKVLSGLCLLSLQIIFKGKTLINGPLPKGIAGGKVSEWRMQWQQTGQLALSAKTRVNNNQLDNL